MTPDQARAARLVLRVQRWQQHRWSRMWGPLHGGALDNPRMVGVLLPHLSGAIQPVTESDGQRRYIICPPETGEVVLTPAGGHLHWLAVECGLTAHLGVITLWGFVRDICLSVALSDIRMVISHEIRRPRSGQAA